MDSKNNSECHSEKLIYEYSFSDKLKEWRDEGNSPVEFTDSGIIVDSIHSDTKQSTLWCDKVFTGDLKVEFTARILPPEDKNNINFFMFFHSDDKLSGMGEYREYHSKNTYIFTYLSRDSNDVTRFRMRKCPGFNLVHEEYLSGRILLNKEYLVSIIHRGNDFTYSVNGKKILKYYDDKPYTSGRMGLRTFRTKIMWSNFKVYSLA